MVGVCLPFRQPLLVYLFDVTKYEVEMAIKGQKQPCQAPSARTSPTATLEKMANESLQRLLDQNQGTDRTATRRDPSHCCVSTRILGAQLDATKPWRQADHLLLPQSVRLHRQYPLIAPLCEPQWTGQVLDSLGCGLPRTVQGGVKRTVPSTLPPCSPAPFAEHSPP